MARDHCDWRESEKERGRESDRLIIIYSCHTRCQLSRPTGGGANWKRPERGGGRGRMESNGEEEYDLFFRSLIESKKVKWLVVPRKCLEM